MDQNLEKERQNLRDRKMTKAQLCNLVTSEGNLRSAAWDVLLENDPDEDCLVFIAAHVPQLREQAWSYLVASKINNVTLKVLVVNAPELRDLAAQMLLRQNPDPEGLAYIIKYCPERVLAAWNMLLRQKPDQNIVWYLCRMVAALPAETLYQVICEYPALRDRAWQVLLTKKPSGELIERLAQKIPAIKQKAGDYLIHLGKLEPKKEAANFSGGLLERAKQLVGRKKPENPAESEK